MKYTLIATAVALLVLTACEGKKSLDGHPMDKPPPSAFAPRDSEPVFAQPVIKEEKVVEVAADEADDGGVDELVANDEAEETDVEEVEEDGSEVDVD